MTPRQKISVNRHKGGKEYENPQDELLRDCSGSYHSTKPCKLIAARVTSLWEATAELGLAENNERKGKKVRRRR